MRCPKCGYLGFEPTDRCRNCGYDFSLASPLTTNELPLRPTSIEGPLGDLELSVSGDTETAPVADAEASGFGRRVPRASISAAPVSAAAASAPASAAPVGAAPGAADSAAEDLPLFAPRPAGTPLAVRRAGAEVPRARRTTRPARVEEPVLPLVPDGPDATEAPAAPARVARPAAPEAAGSVARVVAALVDLVLLLAIDVSVVWLTLRVAGLEPTAGDLAEIRPVPMAAFFAVLAFLYLVGFTLGGGQTIGKMLTGIRVTGDDGRGVDLTGAVVRALGCLVSIVTLGVLYIPAFVGADRRAMHDRLAGTRVVNG